MKNFYSNHKDAVIVAVVLIALVETGLYFSIRSGLENAAVSFYETVINDRQDKKLFLF